MSQDPLSLNLDDDFMWDREPDPLFVDLNLGPNLNEFDPQQAFPGSPNAFGSIEPLNRSLGDDLNIGNNPLLPIPEERNANLDESPDEEGEKEERPRAPRKRKQSRPEPGKKSEPKRQKIEMSVDIRMLMENHDNCIRLLEILSNGTSLEAENDRPLYDRVFTTILTNSAHVYVARFRHESGFRSIPIQYNIENGFALFNNFPLPDSVDRIQIFCVYLEPFLWEISLDVANVIRDNDTGIVSIIPDHPEIFANDRRLAMCADHMQKREYYRWFSYVLFLTCLANSQTNNKNLYLEHLLVFNVINHYTMVQSLGLPTTLFHDNQLAERTLNSVADIPDTIEQRIFHFLTYHRIQLVIARMLQSSPMATLVAEIQQNPGAFTPLRLLARFKTEKQNLVLRYLRARIDLLGAKKENQIKQLWSLAYAFDQCLGGTNNPLVAAIKLQHATHYESGAVIDKVIDITHQELDKAHKKLSQLVQMDIKTRSNKTIVPGEYSSLVHSGPLNSKLKIPRSLAPKADVFRTHPLEAKHQVLHDWLRFIWFSLWPRVKDTADSVTQLTEQEKVWIHGHEQREELAVILMGEEDFDAKMLTHQDVEKFLLVLSTIRQRGLVSHIKRINTKIAATGKISKLHYDLLTQKAPKPLIEDGATRELFKNVLERFLYPGADGGFKAYTGLIKLGMQNVESSEFNSDNAKNTAVGDHAKPPIALGVRHDPARVPNHYNDFVLPYDAKEFRQGFVRLKESTVRAAVFSGFGKPQHKSKEAPVLDYYDVPSNTIDIHTMYSGDLVLGADKKRLPGFPLLEFGSQHRWTELGFIIYNHFLNKEDMNQDPNGKLGDEFVAMGQECSTEFILLLREILYDGHFNESLLLDLYEQFLRTMPVSEARSRLQRLVQQLLAFVITFGNQRYANVFNMVVLPELIDFIIAWSQPLAEEGLQSANLDVDPLFATIRQRLATVHLPTPEHMDLTPILEMVQSPAVQSACLLPSVRLKGERKENFRTYMDTILRPLFFGEDHRPASPVLVTNEQDYKNQENINWNTLLDQAVTDLDYGLLQDETLRLLWWERHLAIGQADAAFLSMKEPNLLPPPSPMDLERARFKHLGWSLFSDAWQQETATIPELDSDNEGGMGDYQEDFGGLEREQFVTEAYDSRVVAVVWQFGIYRLIIDDDPNTPMPQESVNRMRNLVLRLTDVNITEGQLMEVIRYVRARVKEYKERAASNPVFKFL